MNVYQIAPDKVHQALPDVEKYLAAAFKHSQGECSMDQAKVFLSLGKWMLLIAVDDDGKVRGAAAVEFINRINHRVALVVAGGGRLVTDMDTFERGCKICKQHGATIMECSARPSAARLWKSKFGFTEKYAILHSQL